VASLVRASARSLPSIFVWLGLTISMSCLPIWEVLCCFELVLKAIIIVLAGEKNRPRSLALDAVVLRAVCSFLVGLGPCEIMAMSSA
jgi:hypothetical protein